MKKALYAITLIILLTLAIYIPGCTQAGSALNGSGKIIDQDVNIADFDSLEVQGPFDLEIVHSATYLVSLSTDDNLISRVLFSRDDKTLKINIEAPATFFPTSLKIKIGMPEILGLNLSAGAKATISGFQSISTFNLVLARSSSLSGNLEADSTNFYLSGGSQVNLRGKADMLELDATGASKLDLSKFILSGANVKLREASTASLNVNGELNVVLKEASKIYYTGNALIRNTSITGDSSMIHD